MKLDEEQVKRVAKLSAIAVSDEELPSLGEKLSEVLTYFECLKDAADENVPATSHVHGVVNALRDDMVKKSLNSKEIALNAPDFSGNQFRVPKVI